MICRILRISILIFLYDEAQQAGGVTINGLGAVRLTVKIFPGKLPHSNLKGAMWLEELDVGVRIRNN
jgi:hypothetical protein